MPAPDSTRLSAPPALTAFALGTLVLLPFAALDVALSIQASTASAWLFGLALSCTLGGGIGLLTARITRAGFLFAVTVLPAPLLGVPLFWWALRRTVSLYPIVLVAFAPLAIVAVTLLVRRPLRALLERRGVRSRFAGLLSVLLPLVGLFALEQSSRLVWNALCVALLVLAGAIAVRFLVYGRKHWLAWAALACACGAGLWWLDAVYAGPRAIAAGTLVGAGLMCVREAHSRLVITARSSLRAETWLACALWIASAALAEGTVRRDVTVLRAAQGQGLLRTVVFGAQRTTDLDADGYGLMLGQRDCAPFDPSRHPGAHELPGNGIDENCQRGDAPRSAVAEAFALLSKHRPPARCDRDIVIVLIDTLRYDSSKRKDLKTLRALEAESVRFERAYATATLTVQSLLAVLSGSLSSAIEYEWSSPHDARPTSMPTTLFERLRDVGFDVALVGGVGDNFSAEYFGRGARVFHPQFMDTDAADTTALALRAWSELDSTKRRLLYVHYMAVHAFGWDTWLSRKDAYEGRVLQTDAALGTLRASLGADATWIVLSDHGESFGHGIRGHSTSIYDEVVHVPLYIRSPCLEPARIDSVTSLLQVGPTVLALAGAIPSSKEPGPYLCLGTEPCSDVAAPIALHHSRVHFHGVVEGSLHLIRDMDTLQELAFDLKRDPQELKPLPTVPIELRTQLERWEEAFLHLGAPSVFPER